MRQAMLSMSAETAELMERAAAVAAAMSEPPASAELIRQLFAILASMPLAMMTSRIDDSGSSADDPPACCVLKTASCLAPLTPRLRDVQLLRRTALLVLHCMAAMLQCDPKLLLEAALRRRRLAFGAAVTATRKLIQADPVRMPAALGQGLLLDHMSHDAAWPAVRRRLLCSPTLQHPTFRLARQMLHELDAELRHGGGRQQQSDAAMASAVTTNADAAAASLLEVQDDVGMGPRFAVDVVFNQVRCCRGVRSQLKWSSYTGGRGPLR